MRDFRRRVVIAAAVLVLTAGLFAQAPTAADDTKGGGKGTDCKMTFSLKGWSAFYKTSKGEGTITCENGQSAHVKIKATGGGITFGKSEIVGGTGRFSESNGIAELFGSYAQAEAHAGVVKSSGAQALTKGEVSLVLAGTGRGIDLGFSFGKFTITKG